VGQKGEKIFRAAMIKSFFICSKICCLEGEEQQEGHHQTEKSHGF
jgi:hypothetical protein